MARIESHLISGGSSSAITGSGAANQVAVFSAAQVIGGSSGLTYNGSVLAVTGSLLVSNTSGPIARFVDGGLFGTNADPYITFEDAAGPTVGGQVGFITSNSVVMTVKNAIATGSLSLISGTAAGAIFYSQTHASKAGDVNLQTSGSNVFEWDDSASTLFLGKEGSSSSTMALRTRNIFLGFSGGVTETIIIRNTNNDGILQVTAEDATNGGNIKMYASAHGSKPNRTEIKSANDVGITVNGNGNSIVFEFDVQSQGNFQHNGNNFSVFAHAVAPQAAFQAVPTAVSLRDVIIAFGFMAAS